jgi:LysR family transcriptional regulator, transcriptional activator of the cysJI operon
VPGPRGSGKLFPVHLDDMKIFCDVVETSSFSRAASMNSLTQTAVTRKIQAIEARLGCRLIDRGRGQRSQLPTPAGTLFYEGCRAILARHQALVEQLGEARDEPGGTLRVETVYSVGLHEIARHVKTFLRRYPRANIHLECNRSNRIYDNCLTERTDLGIVAYPRERPRIGVIALSSDHMVMICAPDHPLARRRRVALADLQETPFVAFEKDIPTRQAVDRTAAEAGAALDIQAEFDNIETIKRSVEVGLGISVVPRGTVAREAKAGILRAVPLVPACERPIGIIYKRSRPFSVLAKRFIDILLEPDAD